MEYSYRDVDRPLEEGTHFDGSYNHQSPVTLHDLRSQSQTSPYDSEARISPYSSLPYSPQADSVGWDGIERRAASTAPEVVDVGLHHTRATRHGHYRALSPAFSSQSTTVEYPLGSPKQPAYFQSGLEVRPSYFNEGKEVYNTYSQPTDQQQKPDKRRICGCTTMLFLVFLVLIIIVLAALGVGLGVGLGLKHGSSDSTSSYRGDPELAVGGILNPAYYSTKGAFNGSGIAFSGESFVDNEHGIFTVYFQHFEGDLRFIRLNAEGEYIGGRISETVATDAKNNTPISVVAYAMNSTSKVHLFYIGVDGFIKQKSNSNVTNIWEDGALTSLNLKALDSSSVGMQACWAGNFFGDSDASRFPTASGQTNQQEFDISKGMHIWYASDEQTFQQYGIYEGQNQWTFQQEWKDFNGHAGVGCYSWLPGTVSYTMLVNLNNTVDIYWKDTNTSAIASETHPINEWTKAPNASISDVYPSTSLGYTTYFYAQLEDAQIKGYNISFNSEYTELLNDITVSDTQGPVDVIPGTHMSASAVGNPSGGASLYVFAQDEGDDISVYTRDLSGGQWTSGKLPIPDV